MNRGSPSRASVSAEIMEFATGLPAPNGARFEKNFAALSGALSRAVGGRGSLEVSGKDAYKHRAATRGGPLVMVIGKLPGDGRELMANIRSALTVIGQAWAEVIRWAPPSRALYSVRYQEEPTEWAREEWADPYTVADRGWGDCDDLVIWRLAEIWSTGEQAFPQVFWRVGTHGYHVGLRHEKSGREEDPAFELWRKQQ